MSRISSESRLLIAQHVVNEAQDPEEMIDGLIDSYVADPQLNAFRTTTDRKKMRTTAQIMIEPHENTMFVRPVQSHLTFNFWELNHPKHHLWVELLSNRILYQHRKESGIPPFPKMAHDV